MHLRLLALLVALAHFAGPTTASPVARLNSAQRRTRLAARQDAARAVQKRDMTTVTTTKLMTTTVAATTATVTKTVQVNVAAVSTTSSSSSSAKATTAASSSSKASSAASTTSTSKAAASSTSASSSKVTSTTATSTTSAKSSTLASSTKASSTVASSSSAAPPYATSQVAVSLASPPSSSSAKQVFAHHMVGNTYSYTQSTWSNDISLALGASIDAFALNTGSDYWQPAQVASAYAAAKGTAFKLFMSLDMTSLGCASEADAAVLRNYVTTYAKHPNQAMYKGKQLVSTFGGEYCTFGESSTQLGWQKHFLLPLAAANTSITFMPSIFSDPSTFAASTWFDGILNWNSGWPMGSSNLDTSSDQTYMGALGNKSYIAAVSPAFFTYYSPSSWNKDWIYRGDNWLYATRWESIISMRNKFDLVEILTWNDYGESSYIGPIRADQPNSQAWVNNFPHQAYLDMTKFYATAFKTGSFPAVSDKIYVWSRPHPKAAVASAPSMARPTRWEATDDNTYALVMATAASKVTVTSGSKVQAFSVPAGVSRVSMSSQAGSLGVGMSRTADNTYVNHASWSAATFNYTLTPVDYNYNYWVGQM